MKQNIVVCLDPEVIEQLGKTGNKSGTINQVLIEYFNTNKPLAKQLEEKKEIVKSTMTDIEEIQKREDEVTKLKQDYELKEQQRVNKQKNSPERRERLRLLAKESFPLYIIDKDKIDALFNEYWKDYNAYKIKNITEFMKLKGIKRKPDRIPKECN